MRGQLCFKVAHALVRIAAVSSDECQQAFAEPAAVHQLDRRDDDAFLVDLGAERQRTGRHAADVGMVGAAGDEVFGPAVGENGRDHGDVRQMGAAAPGVVEHDDVALVKVVEGAHGRLDRGGHAAEVHGDVRGLGHHARLRVKDRAAEIEALLDVGAEAGAPQRLAHLLGDGGKQAAKDFERDGVDAHAWPPVNASSSRAQAARPARSRPVSTPHSSSRAPMA